jgi:hypothetical protein
MATAVELTAVDVVRNEIERFADEARRRSESDPVHRRRSKRRYHRSWPLAILCDGVSISAALHNASDEGIAFLSCCPVRPGSTVFLKLFCYDESCSYVPAIVRHSTQTEHGHLVGCEFELANECLCQEAVKQSQQAIEVI